MFSILLLLGAHIVHGHGIQAWYVWNILIIKFECSALQMSRVQLVESIWIFPVKSKVTNPLTLGRLTKVYDVTFPIYRESQTKTNVSKMHFLHCMGMPTGTKPLSEPVLTQTYVAIWRHQATMSSAFKISELNTRYTGHNFDGLVQVWGNPSGLAMELVRSNDTK